MSIGCTFFSCIKDFFYCVDGTLFVCVFTHMGNKLCSYTAAGWPQRNTNINKFGMCIVFCVLKTAILLIYYQLSVRFYWNYERESVWERERMREREGERECGVLETVDWGCKVSEREHLSCASSQYFLLNSFQVSNTLYLWHIVLLTWRELTLNIPA